MACRYEPPISPKCSVQPLAQSERYPVLRAVDENTLGNHSERITVPGPKPSLEVLCGVDVSVDAKQALTRLAYEQLTAIPGYEVAGFEF